MRAGTLIGLLLCIAAAMLCGAARAMDEAILCPTGGAVIAAEDQEFNSAMAVWYKHKYKDGEKLLREFSKKHPGSRWRAEADLHVGCYLTFAKQYGQAKQIFTGLAKDFAGTNIRAKATARLGNVAEREGKYDDAIGYYSSILRMNPTWDQFKYANYRGRKLLMTRRALVAKINCGPVALAACLDALGKHAEAAAARVIQGTPDGISLYALAEQAAQFGVSAQTVELPFAELKSAGLPVLAHVQPNHYIAVLGVTGDKAQIEDSIGGKREMLLKDLEAEWSGKAITFAASPNLAVLPPAEAMAVAGGCCGKADEDECQGSCTDDCAQGSSGGGGSGNGGSDSGTNLTCLGCGGGGSGGGNGGSECGDCSAGRPTWKVNTVNLNVLVSDTPIWYAPGKGYNIAFTLNYSNENSNTGIFGRGWHCAYDMKVFFLPENGLQVHRDTGRVETYQRTGSVYEPRTGYANYGYRDTVEVGQHGSVIMSRRGGGKWYFMPTDTASQYYVPGAEGRIWKIVDEVGNTVTCGYTNGALSTVTAANGGITNVTTDGSGIYERVTYVQIPKYENGSWVQNDRHAEFHYTDGNLTYIEDMLGETSTLSYGALAWSGTWTASASTTLAQNVTADPLVPDNGGSLSVASPSGFPDCGTILVNNTEDMAYSGKTSNSLGGIKRWTPSNATTDDPVELIQSATTLSDDMTATSPVSGGELSVDGTDGFPESGWVKVGSQIIGYSGKTDTTLAGITRVFPADSAGTGTMVYLVNNVVQTPYLKSIETPSKKTLFTYEWWTFDLAPRVGGVAALHEVYECGPTEDYPTVPTIHYAWCSPMYGEFTRVTKYPTSVATGASGCTDNTSNPAHWTGGLTRKYGVYAATEDAAGTIIDELGNTIVQYGYNGARDRTSVTDADGHTTHYSYKEDGSYEYGDGNHDMYFRTDPLGNQWTYTYNADHSLHTETDPYAVTQKTYSYNSAGQVTAIAMPLNIQVSYAYDTAGRMTSSTDGRGKTTSYHYNENGETRGFLTSVHDPENKATLYHYDARGRRDVVTDPSLNVTQYVYDDLDRVTKTIYGPNQNDPYTETMYTCCHKMYDQDENGRRTYYLYDDKGRPYKTVKSALSTTLATSITADEPHNGLNLDLASVAGLPSTNGSIVVLDEIIAYAQADTGNNRLINITRGYYSTRKVAVSSGFPVGRVDTVPATYGYHPQYLDWMVSLTDALEHTTYYEYYANGKPKTIRYPDNTGERYTYSNNNSGNNLLTKEYGTFTGTYPDQTFSLNNALTVHYVYDANDRLLRSYH